MVNVWLRYFCVWPGLPPMGDPSTAKVVAVQAYGRNNVPDDELGSIYDLWEKNGFIDKETVAVLRPWFEPGKQNFSLAHELRKILDRYPQLIAIVQWEVVTALDALWYEENIHRVICLWPPKGAKVFRTYEVKAATVRKMKELGLAGEPVIEMAHKRQIVRAYLVISKQLGYHPIIIDQMTDGFDPDSIQKPTSGLVPWLMYEAPCRVHHILFRHVW